MESIAGYSIIEAADRDALLPPRARWAGPLHPSDMRVELSPTGVSDS